ncbi:MAG: serine/threonine-protein kinase [Sumerlaeia bacterium]
MSDPNQRSSGDVATSSGQNGFVREGETLAGNFVISEPIGEGGMATVYKALQKSLNRQVAVKVLHPRFSRSKEFVSRFDAEAGALASLQHPNIVNIIDKGSDTGRYFFIMEHVEGRTLDQLIIDNDLTFQDWRNVIEACREALDYVHKRGVVHRDIKPSNILMDKERRVKIGDFGIAHIVGGDEGEAAHVSQPQRAVGTANYMAPEQTADPASVDHRADIYSLAVAFYKMFCRQLPVGAFPSPSEANHSVPVAVDEVIFRAMCPDRDDRYQTVREFCDELLKALKEQSVSITSVLSYRGAKSGGSVLYSGDDFRSGPKPAADKDTPHGKAHARDKKPEKKPEKKPRDKAPNTGSAKSDHTSGSSSSVKKPSATSPNAKSTKGSGSKTTDSDPQAAKLKRLATLMASLAVVLLLAIVVLVWQMNKTSSPSPSPSGGPVPSITEQRDETMREILQERKRQEELGPDESAPESPEMPPSFEEEGE